ncbi:hypothetical protein OG216_27480 [Streptomycetaceae bacterium NBC_01309]
MSAPAAVELTAELALVLVDLDVDSAQVLLNRLAGAIEAYRGGKPDSCGYRTGLGGSNAIVGSGVLA